MIYNDIYNLNIIICLFTDKGRYKYVYNILIVLLSSTVSKIYLSLWSAERIKYIHILTRCDELNMFILSV